MVLEKKTIMAVGLMMASSCLASATTAGQGQAPTATTTTAAKPVESAKPATPAAAAPAAPVEKPAEPVDYEKASYGIGTRIGSSLKAQNVPVKIDNLITGIKDALAGKTGKYTEAEIEKAMTALQASMEKEMAKNMADMAKKNKEEGDKFLAKNKTEKDVKITKSGLQYKVVTEGKGDSPKDTSKVKVHYRGTLIDGKEFDSSYKRNAPAEFEVNGVIPGWSEALKLMKPGAKWELAIPSELAYGSRGTPGIPPNAVLKFTVELLEVVK
jgi:FKBP-type peptidyl-prolyl cis-trans isomerase